MQRIVRALVLVVFASALRAQVVGPFGTPLPSAPVADRDAMFAKAAVMGDSLTHGFYGAIVRPDTQRWAFPVIVLSAARPLTGWQVNMNLMTGPAVDIPAMLADVHGDVTGNGGPCGPVCVAGNLAGVAGGRRHRGRRVNHVGITGASFSSALHRNDVCADLREEHTIVTAVTTGTTTLTAPSTFNLPLGCRTITVTLPGTPPSITVPVITTATATVTPARDGTIPGSSEVVMERRSLSLASIRYFDPCTGRFRDFTPQPFEYDVPVVRQLNGKICQAADRFHELGLDGLDHNTQMEQIEALRPTFLMVVLGNNHVLNCVFDGDPSNGCLQSRRKEAFRQSIASFEQRVRALLAPEGRLLGGIMLNVPDVTSIPYLEDYKGPGCRKTPCLRAFWNKSTAEDAILDADEIEAIRAWKNEVNASIAATAADLGFALFDTDRYFTTYRQNGGVTLEGTNTVARMSWPTAQRQLFPLGTEIAHGVFSTDGIHPNRLGHTILANAIIRELNVQYGFASPIPTRSESGTLRLDRLNHHPVRMELYTSFFENKVIPVLEKIFE